MADIIGVILEYLRRHHFSRAEAVLREEVSLHGPPRKNSGDDLDLEIAILLKSIQEKSARKREVVPDKRVVTEVKPSAVKEEIREPAAKLDDPELLFTEFEVSDVEHPTKPRSVSGVLNSSSAVSQSPVSETATVERRSPGRIGGLSVLQTEAEVAASSGEKVETSSAVTGKASDSNNGGIFNFQGNPEKDLSPAQAINSPHALIEATRGKVDALKQSEEHGRVAPVQAAPVTLPESSRDKSSVDAMPLVTTNAEDIGDVKPRFAVPKSPEWTDVSIKTIAPIKTSAESKQRSEEGGKDMVSIIPTHVHGAKQGGDSEVKGQPTVEQSTAEETTSAVVERKLTCVAPRTVQEGLPKLAHVRLRSNDTKTPEAAQDEQGSGVTKAVDSPSPVNVPANATTFGLGSYLDIPVGQDISSGSRRMPASARPSVSHGIIEDQSELLSGFATAGDGQSESAVEFADEYWDSDTYEDDDDPGFHRQPIEDEEWFLAHEIDYPSDDERARGSRDVENPRGSRRGKEPEKSEDEDGSFVEEEQSYFSGEEYYRTKAGREEGVTPVEVDKVQKSEVFGRMDGGGNVGNNVQVANATSILDGGPFNRQLLNVDGLPLIGGETRWQGFEIFKGNSIEAGSNKQGHGRSIPDDSIFEADNERVGSARFGGGAGVSNDVAGLGSGRRGSVHGESSEGDLDIGEIGVRSMGQTSSSSQVENISRRVHDSESIRKEDEEEEEDLILKYYNNPWASHKRRGVERETSTADTLHFPSREDEKCVVTKVSSAGDSEGKRHKESEPAGATGFAGFSFPSPSTSAGEVGAVSRVDSGKSMWSVRDITGQVVGEEVEEYGNGVLGSEDPLASWRRKSNESSPVISPRNDDHRDQSVRSIGSANSSDGYDSAVNKDNEAGDSGGEAEQVPEEDMAEVDQHIRDAETVAAEDEEAAAVQEQIRRIRAEEEEFETFDLKVIHRKNRTGFEEDKDFPVVINAVVAGRYHVTEYLGSAAFSKAIQAHDLHTGIDVCMKIIKNNKDFFDQSLDEIKLLKYINKHDPGDKHHLLRLYDYFYHREHLFIVCELLRANLYEFHKYNRESGGEVYFTMPRLQSIARQCLEALQYIHGLGLIHCDLKPENILVKSYSRCEIKVIDLGSSCFQTDHLCSYVQSRSYRAPEVILGLPYNQKIDMWSLGCILAELCSGNVLFQNDSLASLLARVVGILGPIDPVLLGKGRDSHKFFTKNHTLYERNQDSDHLEYLLPKKTSLSHRLPMGDQGFVEFVTYLLNINPGLRPTASEALKHPWLSFPYEPISS